MAQNIKKIASALNDIYHTVYEYPIEESDLTELKMHKLLYFAQKIHYSHFGEWLFNEEFEGWKYGPVSIDVRKSHPNLPESTDISLKEEYSLREVVYDFGQYSASVLVDLTHQESAFLKSRKGLSEDDLGNSIINKEDIIEDIEEVDDDIIINSGV